MGLFSSISSIYLIEIAPEGRKGTFVCLGQIGFVIGLILFGLLGPSLSYMKLNYIGTALCALQASLIWLIEESPQIANINIIEKLQSNQPHQFHQFFNRSPKLFHQLNQTHQSFSYSSLASLIHPLTSSSPLNSLTS